MNYETAGNLRLKFEGHEDFSDYYRDLDISTAVQKTSYSVGSVKFEREVFTSFSDQVMVIELTASEPGQISFTSTMDRPGSAPVLLATEGNNVLKLESRGHDVKSKRLPKEAEPIKGLVKFQNRVKVIPEGGSIDATDTSLV